MTQPDAARDFLDIHLLSSCKSIFASAISWP
ncbi:hypothetical protein [Pseudocitrobacter corydidari]